MSLFCQSMLAKRDIIMKVSNGVIDRTVTCSEGHVTGTEYKLNDSGSLIGSSQEFSFLANDELYSGESQWTGFQLRDTVTASGGKGKILSFTDSDGTGPKPRKQV